MIKISKPPAAPSVLQGRGAAKKAEHCREYDAGQRVFNFDATIYGDVSVKQALIDAQHGKCCFCETVIREEGDIEHFRPKAACRQGQNTRLEKPGYYWLAYDWDNLLLACSTCNQRHKKNYFPLGNLAKRVKNHHGDVTQEEPLFINPAKIDPVIHIAFRKEIPYAVGGNQHGKETIRKIGLDRENLNEKRREHLNRLIYLRQVLDQEENLTGTEEGRHVLEEAREFLQKATLETAQFAAMARAAAALDFRVALP